MIRHVEKLCQENQKLQDIEDIAGLPAGLEPYTMWREIASFLRADVFTNPIFASSPLRVKQIGRAGKQRKLEIQKPGGCR